MVPFHITQRQLGRHRFAPFYKIASNLPTQTIPKTNHLQTQMILVFNLPSELEEIM
jgi:hypothetical protein